MTGSDLEIIDGIDVSHYQGTIDWVKVAQQGGQGFAYIKATDGNTSDPNFSSNWQNSSGSLPRGAYHYFYPTDTADKARPQIDNFVNTLNAAGGVGELPPAVDIEQSNVTATQAAASLQFYLSIVEQAFGKRPIIYTGPSFWKSRMASTDQFASYKLWIAHYNVTRPETPGWTDWAIWQHTVQPGLAGISGPVDRDWVEVPSGTSVTDYLNT